MENQEINLTEEAIKLLRKPKSTSVDGTSVVNQNVGDLLRLQEAIKKQEAACNPLGCIGLSKVVPPSATGN